MDYEKKYKETLERAKVMYEEGMMTERLEYLFPELAESEDEKIRKVLYGWVYTMPSSNFEGGFSREDILAWLEKQCQTFTKKDVDDAYLKGVCDTKQELEKQGEQKSTDGIEPKFRNGQWIVWQDKYYKVNDNYCRYELVDQNGLSTSLEYGTIDENAHVFTCRDAKDGDVLLSSDGSIFIFKEVFDLGCKHYIALEEEDGTIQVNDNFAHCWESVFGVCPATKEQRDTLEKAMADAGYTFDFEKKELKKIDARENLTLAGDLIEAVCMKVEQKPAWSEDDEKILNSLIISLARIGASTRTDSTSINYTFSKEIDWLKSLKQRIGE